MKILLQADDVLKSTEYLSEISLGQDTESRVAFSRSKRKTIIVGNQKTLTNSKFLSRSIDTVTRKDGFYLWKN
jgi:hypothetical protein